MEKGARVGSKEKYNEIIQIYFRTGNLLRFIINARMRKFYDY